PFLHHLAAAADIEPAEAGVGQQATVGNVVHNALLERESLLLPVLAQKAEALRDSPTRRALLRKHSLYRDVARAHGRKPEARTQHFRAPGADNTGYSQNLPTTQGQIDDARQGASSKIAQRD